MLERVIFILDKRYIQKIIFNRDIEILLTRKIYLRVEFF